MLLSITVPAYNEEKIIAECVRNLRAACSQVLPDGGSFEIIVVDNNSSDRTAELARAQGARVVFEPRNQIARARNCGARAASGEWLLFVDADSTVPPLLLRDTLQAIETGRVIGGGATLRFPPGAAWLMRFSAAAWNVISRLFRLAPGSYLFCHAEAFHEAGGFDETLYASEEIALSRELKRLASRRRLRFAILTRHPFLTSDRKWRLFGAGALLRGLFRFALAPRKSVRDRDRCDFWYDSRR